MDAQRGAERLGIDGTLEMSVNSVARNATSSASCCYCSHANPIDAKFCNQCGGPLHLRPCARCDAFNELDASKCYACGYSFAAQSPSAAQAPATPAPGEPLASNPAGSSVVLAMN